MHRTLTTGSALITVLLLSGCGAAAAPGSTSTTSAPTTAAATVTNCGQQHTYTAAPSRVLIGAPGMIDTLDALGVSDRAIGTTLADLDEGELAVHPRLSANTKDWTPAREFLLAADPDLFIANDQQQLTGKGAANQQDLASLGGALYVLGDYCLDNPAKASIATVYTDVEDLGTIFHVQDRADALANRLRKRVQAAAATTADTDLKVAAVTVADGDVYALTGAGYQAVLDALGVDNVFADSKSNYAKITKEAVLAADPDVIFTVSSDRAGAGVQQTAALFPRTAATRNDRIYWQDENAYQAGGVRIIDTLEQAARDLTTR